MKNILIIIILFLSSISIAQQTESEYLTIKVKYGLKTTGFTNEVFVDIGSSGQHSLSGDIFNNDGVVTIDGREYKSEIDLLNYFGKLGWEIYETRVNLIINKEFYTYLLIKKK